MPRACFKSHNLIGDGLYCQPALEEWVKDHPGWDIDLWTLNDYVTCIYSRMGIPNLRVVFEPEGQYDFEFNFDVSVAFKMSDQFKCHVSQSYAKMLGYEIKPRRVKFQVSDKDDHEKGLILLSMFSASCASRKGGPPNKMLSWAHWKQIMDLVRQYGPIASLGGPDDQAQLPLSEDERYHGLPLEYVARMMRDAKVLITVDNGMSHLAATQAAPTIEFYPVALGLHYIVPPGNPNLIVKHMDPTQITVADSVFVVREALKELWRDQDEG
jgi:hypothetical protein